VWIVGSNFAPVESWLNIVVSSCLAHLEPIYHKLSGVAIQYYCMDTNPTAQPIGFISRQTMKEYDREGQYNFLLLGDRFTLAPRATSLNWEPCTS
jgi:hypothetical protein